MFRAVAAYFCDGFFKRSDLRTVWLATHSHEHIRLEVDASLALVMNRNQIKEERAERDSGGEDQSACLLRQLV